MRPPARRRLRSGHTALLGLVALVAAGAACTGARPSELDADALERVHALEADLEANPADVEPLERMAGIYVRHLRFDDAADLIEGFLDAHAPDARGLAKVSLLYYDLSRHLDTLVRKDPQHFSAEDVTRYARRANELEQRARLLARTDHTPVEAHFVVRGETQRSLEEVTLHCRKSDFVTSGPRGHHLRVSYFGDTLRFHRSTPRGTVDVDYRLGEIDSLVTDRDPLGRRHYRLVAASWAARPGTCERCELDDECALVGNRPEGGLEELGLDTLDWVRFRVAGAG